MTVYELLIDKRAEQDIRQGYLYYEQLQPGLGEAFEQTMLELIWSLTTFPLRYRIRYEEHRVANSDRFDYGVHYTVRNHIVEVVGVRHQKQDPDKWTKSD